MGYRDLLPDRWGGAFVASHIRISGGGDVGDVVHFHRIRFQMIHCARGWVDLVYEDQGEPFLQFDVLGWRQPPPLSSSKYTLLGTNIARFWSLFRTDRPNKEQRVFEIVEAHTPDLIILDVMLPDGSEG